MKSDPKLLILSGMHGDEYEVIDAVRQYTSEYKNDIPPFFYIPEVSPSAIARRTRRNMYGHDVNRSFFDPPDDPEVQKIMETLSARQFTLAINFHEDPDLASTFYLYDSGLLAPDDLLQLRSRIIENGGGLHTGKDDPLDANLGLQVEKGYISTPYNTLPPDAGFSWLWFAKHNVTKRDVDVEIPGKAPIDLKRRLVAVVFDTIPLFGV